MRRRSHAVQSSLFALSFATVFASGAAEAQTWSNYFSEENYYPTRCSYDDAVDGVRCAGSYCDDVSIRCNHLPSWITDQYVVGSGYFSEEYSGGSSSSPNGWYGYDDSTSHVCNWNSAYPAVVTGMGCAGRYCDSILVECRQLSVAGQPAEMQDCGWSGWYSEEDPWFAHGATANRWIAGVQCRGRYCDDKSYYVCSIAAPSDSCAGRCGSQSPAGCWCDEACTGYGDCCDDEGDFCQ